MSNNEWDADPTPSRPAEPDATVVVPSVPPQQPQQQQQQPPPPPQQQQPPPPPQQQQPPPPQYGAVPPPQPPAPGYAPAPQYAQPPGYGQQPGYAPAPGYGAPPFFSAPPSAKYRSPGGSITMILGALLAIVGTFLPWVTFDGGSFSDSVNGFETYLIGDSFDSTEWVNPGAYVLGVMIFVILMAIIVLAAGRSTATWILSIIVAGLAGLMTLGAFGAVGNVLDQFEGLTIGVGIVVCLLGAVIAGVGAVIVAAKKA